MSAGSANNMRIFGKQDNRQVAHLADRVERTLFLQGQMAAQAQPKGRRIREGATEYSFYNAKFTRSEAYWRATNSEERLERVRLAVNECFLSLPLKGFILGRRA